MSRTCLVPSPAVRIVFWALLLILLAHTRLVSAEETITVDFGTSLGPAGDPVATGFRGVWTDIVGHMSGRTTPFDLVEPLKPSYVLAPGNWPPSDSLWERAAIAGSTVMVVLAGPCPTDTSAYEPFRGPVYWATLEATIQGWKEHCGAWMDYVDTARVVVVNGGEVTVPIQYDIWNEPDTNGEWHPDSSHGDSVQLFYDVWRAAVDTVRTRDAEAIITGPSVAFAVDGADPQSQNPGEADNASVP